jgi:hypothetical protein
MIIQFWDSEITKYKRNKVPQLWQYTHDVFLHIGRSLTSSPNSAIYRVLDPPINPYKYNKSHNSQGRQRWHKGAQMSS